MSITYIAKRIMLGDIIISIIVISIIVISIIVISIIVISIIVIDIWLSAMLGDVDYIYMLDIRRYVEA